MHIASIDALAVRPARNLLPQRSERVLALAAHGLDGDVHADPLSPRQLLLAGRAAYADLDLPAHALRENLLLDIDTAHLASGTVLQVGSDVLLRLMFQCEACGQLDLQRRGLARALGARRGVLARVLAGGEIRPGDRVRDVGRLLPAWSDDWRERVVRVLDAVPPGHAVEYRQLARLAGIASTYCRAFPAVLRRLRPAYAAKAVAQGADPARPRWHGRGLFDDPFVVDC
ncbi:MOSC domain-containing protein [Massilia sp. TN1-12]|uniref:MOSC domain-containing protein n=1 Tax=Massilia paldalensis TaxID=3377675 RepID=UPI00384CAFF7